MDKKIDAVPIIGTLVLDQVNDRGEGAIESGEGADWHHAGSLSSTRNAFISLFDNDSKEELTSFLGHVERGLTMTISPLDLHIAGKRVVVGLASVGKFGHAGKCTILDLTAWFEGYELAERTKVINATYIRIRDWIETSESLAESYHHVLSEFISLTDAEFGYIGSREVDASNVPFLKTKALTDVSWNEETRELYRKQSRSGFEFRNLKALFGPSIEKGEVVVSNDYEKDNRGVGIPNGHPPLESFLGLPIKTDSRILGAIGVAGRKGGYPEETVARCVGVLGLLSRDTTFLRLFDQAGPSVDSDEQDDVSTLSSAIDRLELPILSMDGLVIKWASHAAGKALGCLGSQLIDLDVSSKDNILGIAEMDILDLTSGKVESLKESVSTNHRDLWVSIPGHEVKKVFLLKYMGVGIGGLFQVIDYTQQVQALVESLDFAEKAAKVSQLQFRLVNMISHELRTPLSSLQTSVELIEMGVSSAKTDQFRPYFDNVYHMVGQMTSHIDAVLTFGRLTTGQAQVVLGPVRLNEVLESVKAELPHQQQERLLVESHSCPAVCWVHSEEALLGLALKNIISNAMKFSDSTVSVLFTGPENTGSVVTVEIRDQGIGIPAEDMVAIFNPFFRAGNASRFSGTGIGLALVKGIVNLLNCSIQVDSAPGKGTIISMRIPVQGQ